MFKQLTRVGIQTS